jgi:hypothetical protein
LFLFLGQFEVEGEEDGEELVGFAEAVGLEGEGVEFGDVLSFECCCMRGFCGMG